MSEKLSQEEVDALLDGVAAGEVEGPSAGAASANAQPVDLLAPKTGAAENLPVLESIQTSLLRHLKRSLGRVFGRTPQLKSLPAQTLKLPDLVARLQVPLNVHRFTLAPLPGEGLLCISPPLAFALVDFLLGGGGSEAKSEEREYSPTENRLLRRVAGEMLRDVERAWEPLGKIECRHCGLELAAAGLGQLGEDFVAALPIEVALADSALGLEICFPVAALKSASQRLAGAGRQAGGGSKEWLDHMRRSLLDTEVAVTAELGMVVIPVGKVLSLKVGDTLTLGGGRNQTIAVRIEGVEKFAGVPGVLNGSNAVRIGTGSE